MVSVTQHAERARDATVRLQDDPGKDLLALLEAEALDIEVRHPDTPTVVIGVFAVMRRHALRETLEQVGDLAASFFCHR